MCPGGDAQKRLAVFKGRLDPWAFVALSPLLRLLLNDRYLSRLLRPLLARFRPDVDYSHFTLGRQLLLAGQGITLSEVETSDVPRATLMVSVDVLHRLVKLHYLRLQNHFFRLAFGIVGGVNFRVDSKCPHCHVDGGDTRDLELLRFVSD